jgi:hypothetical protein
MFGTLVRELDASVRSEVSARIEQVSPERFSIKNIEEIINETVNARVASVEFSQVLQIIGAMEGVKDAQPPMCKIHFSFGDYAREVFRHGLKEALDPLRSELGLSHYEGRVLSVIREAGFLALELIDGPAARCMNRSDLNLYLEAAERMDRSGEIPPADHMDDLLGIGCNFFSPLDDCLEKPEWGLPVGISEESVGHSAVEIRSWFDMMADLHYLNLRATPQFIEILHRESAKSLSAGR